MDKKQILLLIEETEKKFGKGAIFTLGSKYETAQVPRVSTGFEDIDWAIGGGLPEGRIIEIFGPYSAGKTSLALYLASKYELALWLEMEGTFDAKRAKMFGNRKNQFLLRRPEYGEQALGIIMKFAKAGVPLIVLDSVPCMTPKGEMEEKDADKNKSMGKIPGMLSRKLPIIQNICGKSGTTIIFVNQVRDQFGVLFGDPHSSPGGHALRHAVSLKIKVGRKEWLKIKGKAGEFTVGQIVKGKVVKSKVCAPYRDFEVPLIFSKGFVQHSDLKVELKEAYKLAKLEKQNNGGGEDGES